MIKILWINLEKNWWYQVKINSSQARQIGFKFRVEQDRALPKKMKKCSTLIFQLWIVKLYKVLRRRLMAIKEQVCALLAASFSLNDLDRKFSWVPSQKLTSFLTQIHGKEDSILAILNHLHQSKDNPPLHKNNYWLNQAAVCNSRISKCLEPQKIYHQKLSNLIDPKRHLHLFQPKNLFKVRPKKIKISSYI